VNPYETLQVDRRADLDVIRAAYRVLARRHHPDLGGDARKMADVNEAWAILEDPLRRARHDHEELQERLRAAAREATAGAPVMATERPPVRPTPSTPRAEAPRDAETARASDAARNAAAPRGDGTVLDFGRYVGWSITDLGRHDPDYLLWLERTPAGRGYRTEIRAALDRGAGPAVATAVRPTATARPRRSWFR
jgi:curved DNA-binding protein CbpA